MDCSNTGIWRILLWRLGKPYTIVIFTPDAGASDASYSNASTSDANYSNAGTSEAVKAHNRGVAHVQKSV